MDNENSIYSRVTDQFSAAAANYVTSRIHARGKDLDLMIEAAGDVEGKRVLDIATGAGHTAIAFARKGAVVTATDLTPEILGTAREHAESLGVSLDFLQCAAEKLPFADGSFEIVSCRIAPHHFADPAAFVSESTRVLSGGGVFLLIDNIAPEDPRLAGIMNTVERMRDPSHVEAYTVSRWVS